MTLFFLMLYCCSCLRRLTSRKALVSLLPLYEKIILSRSKKNLKVTARNLMYSKFYLIIWACTANHCAWYIKWNKRYLTETPVKNSIKLLQDLCLFNTILLSLIYRSWLKYLTLHVLKPLSEYNSILAPKLAITICLIRSLHYYLQNN